MADTVQTVEREMIEAGGRTAQTFGMNRLLGQLYMALYLSEKPLSLDDLAEQLGVSKASVSISCRQLQSWGAIQRVWVKGDRKDYYEAETDFSEMLSKGLLESFDRKLETARSHIQKSLDALQDGGARDEHRDFLANRLREADQYRARVSKLLHNPLVRRII